MAFFTTISFASEALTDGIYVPPTLQFATKHWGRFAKSLQLGNAARWAPSHTVASSNASNKNNSGTPKHIPHGDGYFDQFFSTGIKPSTRW